MADERTVALAMLGAVESAHFYSAFLPSMMTISKFAEGEDDLRWLRKGEATATGLTLVLGWVLSELTDSYLPFWFAGAMAVVMLVAYEYAIRGKIDAGAFGAVARQVAPVPGPWEEAA